jgi:hypothetical protein
VLYVGEDAQAGADKIWKVVVSASGTSTNKVDIATGLDRVAGLVLNRAETVLYASEYDPKNIVRIELVSGSYGKTTLVSGMARRPLGLALPAAEDRLLIASNAGYVVVIAGLPVVSVAETTRVFDTPGTYNVTVPSEGVDRIAAVVVVSSFVSSFSFFFLPLSLISFLLPPQTKGGGGGAGTRLHGAESTCHGAGAGGGGGLAFIDSSLVLMPGEVLSVQVSS